MLHFNLCSSSIIRIVILFLAVFSGWVESGELRIAAASDLNPVLNEIVRSFEKQSGNVARISFGSSGNLYAQILQGAPYDVFLSADSEYPTKLIKHGFADPKSFTIYAGGKIVLWTLRNIPVENGLAALMDPAVKRVAVPNPRHAPYGRAALSALKHAGVYDSVQSKLILGENVSQTAQFVHSEAVDAGIVSLSSVLSQAVKNRGSYWIVPQNTYPVLEQAGVVVQSSSNPHLAQSFLHFLQSTQARAIFSRYGY